MIFMIFEDILKQKIQFSIPTEIFNFKFPQTSKQNLLDDDQIGVEMNRRLATLLAIVSSYVGFQEDFRFLSRVCGAKNGDREIRSQISAFCKCQHSIQTELIRVCVN